MTAIPAPLGLNQGLVGVGVGDDSAEGVGEGSVDGLGEVSVVGVGDGEDGAYFPQSIFGGLVLVGGETTASG